MPFPFNWVRNSSPKVPSRRSRLMQSAVNKGTRTQIARNRVEWRLRNNAPPRFDPNPCSMPKMKQASNSAATTKVRR